MKKINFMKIRAFLLVLFFTLLTGACAEKKPIAAQQQLSVEGIDKDKAFYVTPTGKDTNGGTSWQDALTLQKAIDQASLSSDKKFVLVAKGIYYTDKTDTKISILLKDGVKLYGGFNPSSSSLVRYAKATILEGNIIKSSNPKHNVRTQRLVLAKDLQSEENIFDGFVLQNAKFFTASGAGLEVTNSKLTARNLLFKNNRAYIAGALNLTKKSQLKMFNVEFLDNESFTNGGAILITNSDLTIDKALFKNNQALSQGGAIRISGTIKSNTTQEAKANLKATNVKFIKNKSGEGAGVFINNKNSYASFANSQFIENYAKTDGAAISAYDSTDISYNNCLFKNNYAEMIGGAIYSQGATSFISNSVFTDNYSGDRGAAIISYDSSKLEISNSVFFKNISGDNGGAIIDGNSEVLNIYNSVFWNNYHKKLKSTKVLNSLILSEAQVAKVKIKHSIFNEKTSAPFDFLSTAEPTKLQENVQTPDFFAIDENGKITQKESLALIKNKGDKNLYLEIYKKIIGTSASSLTEIPATDKDIDGKARLVGENIDIGAYEQQN